jgi:type VI secretion system secreted protein Hcp
MAYDAFLKLGDGSKAKGESTDSKHTNEIEIQRFSIGVANPSTVGSGTSGSGGGKATFDTLRVTKFVDKSSPILLQMSASGDHFDTAQLTIRKAGGKSPLEYLIYTFTQVYIDSIKTLGESGTAQDRPMDEVSFSYASVHVKYVPQKPDGTGDSPVEGGWDLVRNEAK